MAAVINTNVASINAQRNLTTSQSSLSTSLERLSSGLRINSAKDDAAGLAISERFTTQIRGLSQASRNANDAISLSQTAEGALGEVTQNLQRIRELAVQSANSTNSASDRAALDLEVQQRLAEVERIADQTSFNGQKILDGTFGSAKFQVGANVGETIGFDLSTSMKRGAIGNIASTTSTVNLNTIATPNATAGISTSAAITPTNFSTVAGTPGDYNIALSGEPTADSSVVIDGVTFTFRDNTNGGSTVQSATAVDVNLDLTNAAITGTQAGTALFDAITAAKASGAAATNLAGVSATDNGSGTVRILETDTSTALAVPTEAGDTATAIAITTTTASVADDTSANESITIGGTTVALNTNITSASDLVSVINNALDAASNTTVRASAGTGGELVLTTTATGAAATAIAPVLTGAADATTMFGTLTSVNGADNITLAVAANALQFQIGDADAVSLAAGDYTSAQSIIDGINKALAGSATASLNDDGTLTLNSKEAITVSGAAATTLGITSAAVSTNGLSAANVSTVTNSNDTIRRIDSALSAVSGLRSSFGAIQNRFESTIANLGTAVENLSASRSRIRDADFAAETANLTRSQILQQAGTAMLSQANALPQGVLSLLG